MGDGGGGESENNLEKELKRHCEIWVWKIANRQQMSRTIFSHIHTHTQQKAKIISR